MAIVDSAASFAQHCDSIDATSALKNLLNTYAKLAFAIGNPQKPPTEEEFSNFCTTLNGGVDLTLGEMTDVKRMHFEAVTIVIANLKSRVTADTGVEGVRKIPNAEKQARLITQQKRLVGVSITGELQPSHSLIDLVNSMCDSNNVIWIPPSKCSKRENEITMATKEKSSMASVEQGRHFNGFATIALDQCSIRLFEVDSRSVGTSRQGALHHHGSGATDDRQKIDSDACANG